MREVTMHTPLATETPSSVLDRPVNESLLDWRNHGCRINAISFEEILKRYEQLGFLYPAKQEHLAPYMSTVEDNWVRTVGAGQDLRRIVTFNSDDGRRWASVDTWRSTEGTWVIQHLVSNGGGGSRAAIITAVVRFLADEEFVAAESWFRPSNPFPERVLGGSMRAVDEGQATRTDWAYLAVRRDHVKKSRLTTVEAGTATPELLQFVGRNCGQVYLQAAALVEDPLLELVNVRYRAVGLQRFRRIWLCRVASGACVGIALVHRGPLGLNLSFLENRCDLILDATVQAEDAPEICSALLHAALDAYADFPPAFIPTLVSGSFAGAVVDIGGTLLRTYAHMAWLGAGIPRLASFFDAVIRPGGRRLLRAGR